MLRLLRSILVFLAAAQRVISQGTSDNPVVNCTLCRDGGMPNDPGARVNVGDSVQTCLDLFELGEQQRSNSSCTFLQSRGVDVCLCEDELPVLNTNCTLCADGSSLPMGQLEGLPGKTCAQVQVEAMRAVPERCEAYQTTAGQYCGCNATPTIPRCRLCDPYNTLPDPLDMDNATTQSLSCGELELQANFPHANCQDMQSQYATYCCRNVVVPTPQPTTTSTANRQSSRFMTLVSSSVAVWWFVRVFL